MSSSEHPLAKLWPAIAKDLEQAPETVTLPRDEVVRLCKMMYHLGMATAACASRCAAAALDRRTVRGGGCDN